MAGTVTVTRTFPNLRGLVAEGTATGVNLAAGANGRAATSAGFSIPGQGGSSGTGTALTLFVFQNAAGSNGDAGDLLWGAIEFGFVGANSVMLWTLIGSTRALTGDVATTINRGVAGAVAFGTGPGNPISNQYISDRFFASTDPTGTFTAATGLDNGHVLPQCPDSVRVSFFVTDSVGPTTTWNLGWKLYVSDL